MRNAVTIKRSENSSIKEIRELFFPKDRVIYISFFKSKKN